MLSFVLLSSLRSEEGSYVTTSFYHNQGSETPTFPPFWRLMRWSTDGFPLYHRFSISPGQSARRAEPSSDCKFGNTVPQGRLTALTVVLYYSSFLPKGGGGTFFSAGLLGQVPSPTVILLSLDTSPFNSVPSICNPPSTVQGPPCITSPFQWAAWPCTHPTVFDESPARRFFFIRGNGTVAWDLWRFIRGFPVYPAHPFS